ncbi:PBSX family phage terminase large subunit [Candidatus Pacearchaeota archaeon]|jgi:phage terminase large subunit|nr:PBSX family phage terminase large subunit [Candidatus Pacearchaeota archaeon]
MIATNSPRPKINFDQLPELVNDIYYPFLFNSSRYLVFYGSAGSGKSVFITQKLLYRMLSEQGHNHKFLVVRKVGKTIRESVFAEIKNTINAWGLAKLFKINKTDMTITAMNGNVMMFAGLDDVEKLKSISGVTGIWIEEASEVDQADLQQLDLRLRGKTHWYKQIIISFNPVSILHWLKTVFFDQPPKNCRTLKTTYKDNRFLDQEYINVLLALKDKDPYYYMVYALGEWGVIGKTIFPAQLVSERIEFLKNLPVPERGSFIFGYQEEEPEQIDLATIKWVADPDGPIAIYQPPVKGRCYVIGGDTAGDGSDNFTGQVIDMETDQQTAVLKHQYDEDIYARQMYCLAFYYNTALLSIEANFSTYPIKELQRLRYPHQYRREKVDEISLRREYRYGWRTDLKSRPLAIAGLVKVVRENVDSINDIGTLEEMLTFVRDERGKAVAQEGKHDDLILGLAIAHATKHQGYLGAGDGILPDSNRKRKHYDFNTEAGRDDDDDEEGYGRSFFG